MTLLESSMENDDTMFQRALDGCCGWRSQQTFYHKPTNVTYMPLGASRNDCLAYCLALDAEGAAFIVDTATCKCWQKVLFFDSFGSGVLSDFREDPSHAVFSRRLCPQAAKAKLHCHGCSAMWDGGTPPPWGVNEHIRQFLGRLTLEQYGANKKVKQQAAKERELLGVTPVKRVPYGKCGGEEDNCNMANELQFRW